MLLLFFFSFCVFKLRLYTCHSCNRVHLYFYSNYFVYKMEKFVKVRKRFCKLCLDVIKGGSFKEIEETVKEVLDILQLKLNVQQTKELVICEACSAKLFAAFKFKATCMDTEDCIFPYVNSGNGTLVDLREIYLKERGKEHLKAMLEDENICRLCMQVITCGFTPINEIDVARLHRYIPEVNFSASKDSVICKACLDALNVHVDFLTNCSNVEIKPKNVEINHEDNNKDASLKITEDGLVKNKNHRGSSRNPRPVNKLKCDVCGYKAYKLSFALHQLKHRECPDLPTFKCDKCDYKTQRKSNFNRHEMMHKDIAEVRAFKCSKCDFVTKIKQNLERHQLTHKDFAETPTYKCDICGMETIHKYNFRKHQAFHKDSSQVRMYKCDRCDFKTKHKSSLGFHRLRHKNPWEMETYKCQDCDYITTQKNKLSTHKLLHNNPVKYMCDTCGYETKIKGHLIRHMLVHKNSSEENLYRCSTCNFTTLHKSYLKVHEIKHKDVTQVQMYTCDKCGFKSRRRDILARHRLTQKCLKRTVIQA